MISTPYIQSNKLVPKTNEINILMNELKEEVSLGLKELIDFDISKEYKSVKMNFDNTSFKPKFKKIKYTEVYIKKDKTRKSLF